MQINRNQLEQALTDAGIVWQQVDLQGTASVIVSSYGGRVYGPFMDAAAPSMNWIPDAFGETETLRRLIDSGFWNVGGERIWIGPEIRYMIPDRSDYWGSYTMPPQLDPGMHTLEPTDDGATLKSAFQLESYLAPTGPAQFTLDVHVTAAANPLWQLADYDTRFAGIAFAGYASTAHLTQSGAAGILSESWILNQVLANGTALIPTISATTVTDYYEEVGDNLEYVAGGITVELSGTQRFKIGVKAAHNHGRLGYLRRDDNGSLTLIVRAFPNDPSAEYTEEPDFAPGVNGDSIHLYNDDGGLGGFAELEARGRTVGQTSGQTESTDRFSTWCFQGTAVELDWVAHQLLGMQLPYIPAIHSHASLNTYESGDTE